MKKFTFYLIAAAMLVVIPQARPALGQEGDPQPPPRSPQSVGELRYVKEALPALHRAHNKRVHDANQHVKRLVEQIGKMKSQAGVKAFVEHALGWKSKTMIVSDKDGHRRWMKQLFKEHVLQLDEIQQAIRIQSRSLEASFNATDTQLLVALETDCDLTPIKPRFRSIDSDRINRQVDAVADQICDSVYRAVEKSLVSLGVGMASGVAGHQIARNQLASDGEISIWDELIAGVIGIGVDIAASEIADQVMETDKTLAKQISELADQVIGQCIHQGGAASRVWVSEFAELFHHHNRQLIKAVSDSLGIDSAWAKSVY